MKPTLPRQIQIREEARKRLVEALNSTAAPCWTTDQEELEAIGRRILLMKEWLLTGSQELSDTSTAFAAEDIMSQLETTDWRTLGVINAALHELSSQGVVAVLDPGTPAIFSFRNLTESEVESQTAAARA